MGTMWPNPIYLEDPALANRERRRRGIQKSHTEDNRYYFLYVQYGFCYLSGTRIELYKILVMSL